MFNLFPWQNKIVRIIKPKSKRARFTYNISKLIVMMFEDGEEPLLDYIKRSDAGQVQMYEEGKSKCDGFEKRSKHQDGMAADIYFTKTVRGKIVLDFNRAKYKKWHRIWTEVFGGDKMIPWDIGHFQ